MSWKGFITGFTLAIAAFVWTGCQTPGAPQEVVCQADEIRSGDTLTVSFLDIPEPILDKEFQVRADGTVNLPLIGSVKATGKKLGEFEAEIQKSYVPRFYTRLTLVVKPGTRFYFVGGEVKQPGQQIYLGQTTVLRAITSAGDFTDFANRRRVEIIRANGQREIVNANKIRQDPRLDRPICPGDAVYVQRSL